MPKKFSPRFRPRDEPISRDEPIQKPEVQIPWPKFPPPLKTDKELEERLKPKPKVRKPFLKNFWQL